MMNWSEQSDDRKQSVRSHLSGWKMLAVFIIVSEFHVLC